MALASFREMELHITEWNFSLYDRHLLHDTMFMAPFVMYHAMNTLGDVKAMAFWCFTDVFEESLVPSSPFYGGFGLMNRDGLKKPSYYAFELLQKLGERSPLRVMVMWPLRIKMGACSFCCIIMSIWIICFQAGLVGDVQS